MNIDFFIQLSLIYSVTYFILFLIQLAKLFFLQSNFRHHANRLKWLREICCTLTLLAVLLYFSMTCTSVLDGYYLPQLKNFLYITVLFQMVEIMLYPSMPITRRIAGIFLMTGFYPFWLNYFGGIWYWLMLAPTFYFLYEVPVSLYSVLQRMDNGLHRMAVNSALDGMPHGILIANRRGRTIFVNEHMKQVLARHGIGAQDNFFQIRDALFKKSTPEIGNIPVSADTFPVRSPDETTLFQYRLLDGGRQFYKLTAIDITEIDQINRQIARQTAALKVTNEDLTRLLGNLEHLVDENVRFNYRRNVHDVLGQRLSILHHYLDRGEMTDESLARIKDILIYTPQRILEDEQPDPNAFLQEIITTFEMLHFYIHVDGSLPEDNVIAMALIKVIREAVTNSIMHGKASNLFVRLRTDPLSAEISDDGRFIGPEKPKFGGGLSAIENNLELLGLKLEVDVSQGFRLFIRRAMPDTMRLA